MPVIQARESIERINQLIYGNGHMDKQDGNNFIRNLREEARGRSQEAVMPRPKNLGEASMLSHQGDPNVPFAGVKVA